MIGYQVVQSVGDGCLFEEDSCLENHVEGSTTGAFLMLMNKLENGCQDQKAGATQFQSPTLGTASGFHNSNSDNRFHFAIPGFSLFGDECVPLDPEDADPYEVSMDSSQTQLTFTSQKIVAKKEGLELLDEAIATAAEQTGPEFLDASRGFC